MLVKFKIMEKVAWKVEGMHCANCALNVNRALIKNGMQAVAVNPISGDVSFETINTNGALTKAKSDIEKLGYSVKNSDQINVETHDHHHGNSKMLRFWICLPFTLILMSHMIPGLEWHLLMNPWVQFGLALPVYLIGMQYFGSSAWRSIRGGIPNMDVLIAVGATAAFGYSTYGLFTPQPEHYLFYETAASIITIVFFGNYLEDASVKRTQKEINKLSTQQIVMANMIAYDDAHNENIFPVKNTELKVGDLILIRTGEPVPMDCKILSGEAEVNEALITGESIPVLKKSGDILIGGSVLANGNIKAYVQAVGDQTVMSGIVALMKKAQTEKPPVQLLADKISAVFIPVVLIIAVITLVGNMTIGHHSFTESLMRSIAVLVISCPCAMGLATPAAIAVGLGRAAKNGILFTDVSRMELFAGIKQMVFDKTGTLTTGKFKISNYHFSIDEAEGKRIVYSLEKMSNHPIARSIAEIWKSKDMLHLKKTEEIKGLGMRGEDKAGNVYVVGSKNILTEKNDTAHDLYVIKNNEMVGWINIADEVREEAKDLIDYCHKKGISTTLLSGDTYEKCKPIAALLGIENVLAEKNPAEKLAIIETMTKDKPTAMVGDGINDAPALAKATISISLAEASHLAIHTASVVLTSGGLKKLPTAMALGAQTYRTVQTNLFWAFAYNIVAIPVAAFGYLHPAMSALIMGGSDVVLAANSLWLGIKKLS